MGWGCGSWRRGHGHDEAEERTLSDRGLMTVILDVLKEGPASGYDLLQKLEERLKDLFAISPGGVYPSLQLLEDQGFISATQEGDRKVYAVTEEGRKFLGEREEALAGFWERVSNGRYGLEVRELVHALKGLAWEFRNEAGERRIPPEKIQAIREAIANTRKVIDENLAG